MNNQLLFFLTAIVVVGIGFLLWQNAETLLNTSPSQSYVLRGNVRGIDVEVNDKKYTLSFVQQNLLIDFLNRAQPLKTSQNIANAEKQEISKILIHQFNDPNPIEVRPIGYLNNNLLFSAPAWYPEGLLQDTSEGALRRMLIETYE
jgi:hypothetical protein